MADIGLVGLGVMGANLALNMAEKGYRVAVYNRTASKTEAFVAEAGSLAPQLTACVSVKELAAAIAPPRPVIILVQAGAPVDETAQMLAGELATGDMLIDAGNANFRDTRRRVGEYMKRGLDFLGVGISGGEEGARHGPSIMAGGNQASWARVEKILVDISAKFNGEPCAALVGPEGAGHFVKTIHNGIEYADMQMIAEIYGVLRDGLGFAPGGDGRRLRQMERGPAEIVPDRDQRQGARHDRRQVRQAAGRHHPRHRRPEGHRPLVGHGGAGPRRLGDRHRRRRWRRADFRRSATSASPRRRSSAAAPMKLGDALGDRKAALATLEQALLAGKIAAYAQGFAVMAKASEAWDWKLPLGTVAKIWRAGCIIRSVFLDDISRAYSSGGPIANLMLASPFAATLKETEGSLRRVVAAAALKGIPVPALSSALAYFDMSRTARTTANLIQGQRDFFGAHGFERTDSSGKGFHGPWHNPSAV